VRLRPCPAAIPVRHIGFGDWLKRRGEAQNSHPSDFELKGKPRRGGASLPSRSSQLVGLGDRDGDRVGDNAVLF
jgi:hypothetical protein